MSDTPVLRAKGRAVPYSLPVKLEADLARVRRYWEGLKRGEADVPFGDDVNLSVLSDLSGGLMLIEAFHKPVRFRLAIVGDELKTRYGADIVGRFSDEIEVRHPFQYLNSQCFAAAESRAPTYYRHEQAGGSSARAEEGYSRLVLPMWGEGRVATLLAAVAWK
jgi:hypothetical protein